MADGTGYETSGELIFPGYAGKYRAQEVVVGAAPDKLQMNLKQDQKYGQTPFVFPTADIEKKEESESEFFQYENKMFLPYKSGGKMDQAYPAGVAGAVASML